ncbi:MAG: hypothetical protein K8963_07685, partial [Proteobacteria bacterium]|nr:hypothetical protein [Pseudomonadota bacterium]
MKSTPASQPGQSEFSVEWLEGALEWILAHAIRSGGQSILLVCPAQPQTELVGRRLHALLGDEWPVHILPDVEHLPYDHYSPAQESVGARLQAIAAIAEKFPALVLTSPANIVHRLPPLSRLRAYTMRCETGMRLSRQRWTEFLSANAYYACEAVEEPGSFSVRGDIVDVFVHGEERPWRIDTLDDVVTSIRAFNIDTGKLGHQAHSIELIPGALVPLDDEALDRFKTGFAKLAHKAEDSAMYSAVLSHRLAQGIESYFSLFYESTLTLPELLDAQTKVLLMPGVRHTLEHYLDFSVNRYEGARNDPERPLVAPSQLLLSRPALKTWLGSAQVADLDKITSQRRLLRDAGMDLRAAPALSVAPEPRVGEVDFFDFLKRRGLRCIVCSSSPGRMSYQLGILSARSDVTAVSAPDIRTALQRSDDIQITVAPFEHSFIDRGSGLIIVGESVFGSITRPVRHSTVVDELTRQGILLNSLDDLRDEEPIIHPEHGVGRYAGVTRLDVNDASAEFVLLNYAGGGKLYVPIDQVFLLDRYHLSEGELEAPWHTLRSSQWRKATRTARATMDDLASRIIALHAARQKSRGLVHRIDPVSYQDFCSQFPYQETPDQRQAIQTILQEMQRGTVIDRLVVGEVG